MKTSNNNSLNFGIVGYGAIAKHHIQSIQAIPDCNFIALATRSSDNQQLVAKRFGVKVYTSCSEMLDQVPEIDVLVICTPNGFHLEPCLEAAAKGKHVITEKPLEINTERCQKMIDACDQAGVVLACIFQNRFIPGYQQVLNLIRNGAIEKMILCNAYVKWYRSPEYYASSSWRGTKEGEGGSALMTQSIHYIDQLIYATGPVKNVIGKTTNAIHDLENEDLGLAILEFENGALGTIEGSTAIKGAFPERLEFHGSAGSIILEAGSIVDARLKDGFSLDIDHSGGTSSASANPSSVELQLHINQYMNIVDSIRNGSNPEIDGREAIKSIRVLEAIYKSASLGQSISI
jgi:predicted dehydrogenase